MLVWWILSKNRNQSDSVPYLDMKAEYILSRKRLLGLNSSQYFACYDWDNLVRYMTTVFSTYLLN